MNNAIISIEDLGKCYRIRHSHQQQRYVAMRDVLSDKVRKVARNLSFMLRSKLTRGCPVPNPRRMLEYEEFWALQHISLEVKQGDVVGIIGRNGAGKSTLLKVLSRITEPTQGRVRIKGRVTSLLEVGTGFHPELTGRENIFLNGAILGMSRSEIKRKYDEIVSFAEVEKFVDTPVKRYSSGMYVRLAFSVAAHLESEILIVDEVLAVGDAAFQHKCLGQMHAIAGEGRTVIFVSHNMGTVRRLCNSGVVLNQGGIQFIGTAEAAVSEYIGGLASNRGQVRLMEDNAAIGSGAAITLVQLSNREGIIRDVFHLGDSLSVTFGLRLCEEIDGIRMSFVVKSPECGNVYHCVAQDAGFEPKRVKGSITVRATFEQLCLYPGRYVIDDVWIADKSGHTLDNAKDVLVFDVLEGGQNLCRPLGKLMAIVHEVPSWRMVNGCS